MHASGTFDVKLTPQATDESAAGTLGRMSIEKQHSYEPEYAFAGAR